MKKEDLKCCGNCKQFKNKCVIGNKTKHNNCCENWIFDSLLKKDRK